MFDREELTERELEEENGFKLSLALPGEKLIEKMWDSLTKNGVATLLQPWHIARKGKANAEVRRYEILALAQARADAADVKAGRKRFGTDGKLVQIASTEPSNLLSLPSPDGRVEPRLNVQNFVNVLGAVDVANTIQAEVNVAQTVAVAEQILAENANEPTAKAVDDDWLATWREYVSKVSSEELQYLWANALAGEVASPGNFSIRTLDFLRTLSQSEAEEIASIAPYYIQGLIIKDVEPISKPDGVSDGKLLKMEELGIIMGVGGSGLTTTYESLSLEKYERALMAHKKILLIERAERDAMLTLPVFTFTELGKQLMRLGQFTVNDDYLLAVGRKIAAMGFQVFVADIVAVGENEISFSNQQPIIL